MLKGILSGIVVLLIMSGIAFAETMPVPASQQDFTYDPVDHPVMSADPDTARPVGVGSIATGGDTLSLHIGLGQFSGPVDIYVGIYAPSIDPDIYVITPGYSLQPVSTGLEPWKENTNGPIDEYLFGDIPISLLPSVTYYLYLAVTPADSISTFYIWSTYFIARQESLSVFLADDCTYGQPHLWVTGTLNIGGSPCGISSININGLLMDGTFYILASQGPVTVGFTAYNFSSTSINGTFNIYSSYPSCYVAGGFSMNKDSGSDSCGGMSGSWSGNWTQYQ